MGLLTLVPAGYRLIALALAALALVAFGWFKGNEYGTRKLTDYIGKQAVEAVRIITRRGQVTERVVVKYIKVAAKTAGTAEAIKSEVQKYAEKNRTFTLDTEFRSLHDRAALNAVPEPTGKADATSGAPTAAEALGTVTENYARHHRTADRLDALQEWVREQQRVK